MTVLHTYTSTWNDLYMVRYYVRHWAQYASKIFVYDDDSTDGTREFLASCAPLVEIKSPGFHGLDELLLQEMRNREYRINSRGIADWVVIGDSDELHHHPRMLEALAEKKARGYRAVISHGWHMLADKAPEGDEQMTAMVKEGVADYIYSRVIFDPALELSIAIGHHGFTIADGPEVAFTRKSGRMAVNDPEGTAARYPIDFEDREFKMLHYRYLGEDYIKDKNARNFGRLSDRNKEHRWGWHYFPGNTGTHSLHWAMGKMKEKVRCID